jgi:hypothetical protein
MIAAGRYELGPDDGTVAVRTHRTGAAAKAGHDLLLHVTGWRGEVEIAEGGAPTALSFEADTTSFRVIEGTGGIQALGDDDRASIVETIDDEILHRAAIAFRSTAVEEPAASVFRVHGDLTLVGETRPLTVDVTVADGALHAAAVVVQSSWGIKPYSALFGALRVADDVAVAIDAALPQS